MATFAQILGALLILAAFTLTQRGVVTPRSLMALLLNLAGSAILAVVALGGLQWGFLILNTVWFIVAAWGMIGWIKTRRAAPAAS
ncbi:MAG: CBU_0592 family membrane protein [Rhodoglobus sp.]